MLAAFKVHKPDILKRFIDDHQSIETLHNEIQEALVQIEATELIPTTPDESNEYSHSLIERGVQDLEIISSITAKKSLPYD